MNDIFFHGFGGPGVGMPGPAFGLGVATFGILLLVATAWSLVWKGIALWHAARGGEKIWFIALMVINTLGIFEILYIFVFRKGKRERYFKSAAPVTGSNEKRNSSLPTAESSPAE